MSSRKKAFVWVIALSVAAGAVIVHMIAWHNNGMHLEMFQWPETGKGYLTALYNLVVMLVLGGLLGLVMVKVTDLISGKGDKIDNLDEENNRKQ